MISTGNQSGFQSLLRLIYPSRCTACGDQVESDFGLCGPCWRDTPFIGGMCCDLCGVSLPGPEDDTPVHCDECLKHARPWAQGRAALLYRDVGRRLVLALKYGDRHDIVRPAALWMARAAQPMLRPGTVIAPVPLHWSRMLKRRFNQSALLARAVGDELGHACCPDLLIRPQATPSLGGLGYDMRYRTMEGAITLRPSRRARIIGRHVLLVDDVMTSGATLSVAAQVCLGAGASDVSILVLARAGGGA